MFIFMEYCADGTISDVSKLGLPETMIRMYTRQILLAVNVLHEKGIVHRDVKGKVLFSCNVMTVLNGSEHILLQPTVFSMNLVSNKLIRVT